MAVVKSPKNVKKKQLWIKKQKSYLSNHVIFNDYFGYNKVLSKTDTIWSHRSNKINRHQIKSNVVFLYL